MAVTITPEILGQVANATFSYSYLFEPLRVLVAESTSTATKIFVDLQVINSLDASIVETLVKYAEFDLNPNDKVSFDLMEIARQHRNSNTYKFSNVDDMLGLDGLFSVTSEFRYIFRVYSDVNATFVDLKKVIIVGAREFEQFNPIVTESSPINEFQFYGLDEATLEQRWGTVFLPKTVLKVPTVINTRPTLTKISPSGEVPCGEAFLIWKSRFGGWMWWGFDLKNKTLNHRYEGNLEVGMFESTLESGGDPYIPVDYTGISTSYALSLKSLALTKLELQAVSGIKASAAVYFQQPGSQNVELMRLASATTPFSVIARGGDFSVSLRSISKSSQTTI
ncbi:MAG: hypothetical protein QQN55_03665 [Nitrosopumilus sp.]